MPAARLASAAIVIAFFIVTFARPRLVPYLAMFALVFQSTSTATLTSDGLALAGVLAGLLAARLRAGWDYRPAGWNGAWAFLALNLLIGASLLVNLRAPQGGQTLLNSEYFVSRALLLLGVAALSLNTRRDWLVALAAVAAVLAALRLVEVAGADVRAVLAPFGVTLLGDVVDVGSWNVFATLLTLALPMALAGAATPSVTPVQTVVGLIAASVIMIGVASAQSRTAAALVVVIIAVLLAVAQTWPRRAAVLILALVFGFASFSPLYSLAEKPLTVATTGQPDTKVATAETPLVVVPPGSLAPQSATGDETVLPGFAPRPHLQPIKPDWRSVLDRNYYELQQRVDDPHLYPHGNYLAFLARKGGGNGVELQVSVGDREITRLTTRDMWSYYRWIIVYLPDDLQIAGPMVIKFKVIGNADSQSRFFTLAGLNDRAVGISSLFLANNVAITGDLSPDPGIQQGVVAAFLNGQTPDLTPLPPVSQGVVLDPSLADRLALWRAAVRVFAAHPLVGTGFYTFGDVKGQFQNGAALFSAYANAHNNFMELLADLGIGGPLLFLVLLVSAVGAYWRNRSLLVSPSEWWHVATLGAVLVMFAASMTQTWLADSRVYLPGLLLLLVLSRGKVTEIGIVETEREVRRATASAPTALAK